MRYFHYRCMICHHSFVVRPSVADDTEARGGECPWCGSGQVEQEYGAEADHEPTVGTEMLGEPPLPPSRVPPEQ